MPKRTEIDELCETTARPDSGASSVVDIGVPRRMHLARRIVLDILLILALGVLAAIVFDRKAIEANRDRAVDVTRTSVRAMQAMLDLQVALGRSSLEDAVYPAKIDPSWFGERRPTNELVGDSQRWLDIAPLAERSLRHPRDITVDGGGAMFWYNPALGVVRARVPRTLSDAEAIALYNAVNGAEVLELLPLVAVDQPRSTDD